MNKKYYLQDNGTWAEGVGDTVPPNMGNLWRGTFAAACERECTKRATKYIIGGSIAAFAAGVILTLMIKK